MKTIQARKRELLAESEIYRQMLTLEIYNLRLYGTRLQRNLELWRLLSPLLLTAGSLFGLRSRGGAPRRRQRGKWSRWIGALLMGWRLYRRYGPTVQTLLLRRPQRQTQAPEPAAPSPAANV